MENNELMHHGIVGMKWGVRRFQNKDGTLTARGKKRYEKELAKIREEEKVVKNREQVKAKQDRLNARRASLEERKKALDDTPEKKAKAPKEKAAKPRAKSLSEMSDAELQAAINRLNLENQYKSLNPVTVSSGKKFMDSARDDVLIPALKKGAKEGLTKVFERVFGDAGNTIYDKIKGATNSTDEVIKKEFKKSTEKEFKKSKIEKEPLGAEFNKSTPSNSRVDYYDGIVRDTTPALPSGTKALPDRTIETTIGKKKKKK